MLRASAVILTFWAGVRLVLALGILAMLLVFGKNAPILLVLYGDIQGRGVDATRGTWMAKQIEAGRAAGTIFEDLDPDSIARAIARCVVDLKSLQHSAQALSIEWRKESCLSAFVDFMEEQIALRSS